MIINIREMEVKKVRIYYDVRRDKYSAKIIWEDLEYELENKFDLSDEAEKDLFKKIIFPAGVESSRYLKRRRMRVAELMFSGEVLAVGSLEKDEWLLLDGKRTGTYSEEDLYEIASEIKEPIFW